MAALKSDLGDQPDAAHLAGLMRRIGLRDRDAFGELYGLTSGRVFGAVLRICPHRSAAEDVLQEVYVSIWNSTASFDITRGHPLGWLVTVARHRAIDSVRRRRPESDLQRSTLGEDDDPYHAMAGIDVEDAVGMSTSAEIGRCLALLSPIQRQCIALAFYRGLTHSEVAAHLGFPLGTIKSHVRKALISIREAFGKQAVDAAPADLGA